MTTTTTNASLGNVIDDSKFVGRLKSIKQTLEKKQLSEKDLSSKVKALSEINKNVSESYNVSLKIIVDVTKLLNQYMVYFNEIDKLMETFSTDSSNTLNNQYFQHINKITSEKIDELSKNFKSQLDSLKTVYSKNNIPTEDLDRYSGLLDSINTESKLLLKTEGGRKLKKKASSKR
tara:strand:- start:1697 stop:2224 length:528 start_codon:yes stop_codon:yes gene_type:complete